MAPIGSFNYNLLKKDSTVLRTNFLFGSNSLNVSDNSKIINATTDYILSIKGFDEPLFYITKVVSTDHNQASSLMNQIIHFQPTEMLFLNQY